MTTPYTPSPLCSAADPDIHADGDAANAVDFNRPLTPLLDARAFLKALIPGMLRWSGQARVAPGGASSGNTGVYVGPIDAVALLDGTDWKVFSLASETQLTTAANFAGGTLNSSTWYYVFAEVSGGALLLRIRTGVPDAALLWRDGATNTSRYLFSFVTDSSGVPVAMQVRRGRYLYRRSALGSNQTRVLNTSTVQGSPTDLSLAAVVPPHARQATVQTQLTNSGGGSVCNLYVNGDTSDTTLRHDNVDGQTSTRWGEIECDSAQKLDYTLSISAGTATLTAHVAGFAE